MTTGYKSIQGRSFNLSAPVHLLLSTVPTYAATHVQALGLLGPLLCASPCVLSLVPVHLACLRILSLLTRARTHAGCMHCTLVSSIRQLGMPLTPPKTCAAGAHARTCTDAEHACCVAGLHSTHEQQLEECAACMFQPQAKVVELLSPTTAHAHMLALQKHSALQHHAFELRPVSPCIGAHVVYK